VTMHYNLCITNLGVYGKPGTPEQPGSAGTALFWQLGSRATIKVLLIAKTLTAELPQPGLIISSL